MPLGRYPERVKPFRKWSQKQVDDAKISGSATPGGTRATRRKKKKRRRRSGVKDLGES